MKYDIVLYSPVADLSVFDYVGFYVDDIHCLKMNEKKVLPTNKLIDILVHRPNILICYFYSKSLFAGVIGRLLGAEVKYVGGADQIESSCVGGWRIYRNKLFALLCLLVSSKVLPCSTNDVKNFQNLFFGIGRLFSYKIKYAPHAVRYSISDNVAVTNWNEFKIFTICWLGSVSNVERKGVLRCLKFIEMSKRLGKHVVLYIAGGGEPGIYLIKELSKKLNIESQVIILGIISDSKKYEYLTGDFIYFQLSNYEGFGLAAAEAYLSGAKVVHSSRGGLSDIMGDDMQILDNSTIDLDDLSSLEEFYNNLNSSNGFKGKLINHKRNLYSLENRRNNLIN